MFSSHSLFANIICPFNDECGAMGCVFQHSNPAQRAWLNIPGHDELVQAPAKRRKVNSEFAKTNGAVPIPKQETQPQVFVGALVTKHSIPKANGVDKVSNDGVEENVLKSHETNGGLSSTDSKAITSQKPISPPPIRRLAQPFHRRAPNQNVMGLRAVQESLNPRMVKNDPAGHATRTVYLKKLHEGMARLNNEVKLSSDQSTNVLALTDGQLISLALDEEQKIAVENPAVYANVIKLRMVAYKKMTLEHWKMARLEARVKAEAPASKSTNSNNLSKTSGFLIETGLGKNEEIQMLSHLVAKQEGLEQFGLVVKPPTEEEIKTSKAGVEASEGWEKCERCQARFQVFPDRREDGALTSGGQCTYHHGRITYPDRDQAGGRQDRYYSCCHESIGVSAGCTTGNSHVFKIYDGKRLASILQYERTPNNPSVADDQAVSFDCEMGFTVNGMELIRLTATAWPGGNELLDILVRPLGAILDLNSRYSGVQPEDFFDALPFKPKSFTSSKTGTSKPQNDVKSANGRVLPPIVESPMIARNLLFELLSPSTPLIGHAIENDLNAARIVHPCIIDTVLLYPHPSGLPRRRALKALTKQHLGRDIQNGGVNGHDSKEDALATGDLVRVKVGRKWKEMQREGWTRQEGRLVPPRAGFKAVAGAAAAAATLAPIPAAAETSKPIEEAVVPKKRAIAQVGEGHE